MTTLGIDIGGTSVKLAALRAGEVQWTSRGAPYNGPTAEQIAAAIRDVIAAHPVAFESVGLCVPGLLDESRTAVKQSVNLPGLNGVRLGDLLDAALGYRPGSLTVLTDNNATGIDVYASRRLTGRLFVLAIGAGVGASVIDSGMPLRVDGDSPGHFGQMDVSLEGEPVIGPDGGAGSLEGYISAGALDRRYGADRAWLSEMKADHPPVRALARAVRVAHAIYRPHHVCLAGGIGNRLGPILPDLRRAIERNLTNIARPGWALTTGDSDFHAAQGAARAAAAMQK